MKVGLLRKIYPFLSKNVKNLKWRSLTNAELDRAMTDKQVIANCYDEATRYALLASEKGRDLLRKRIKIEKGAKIDSGYKFKLNVGGKEEVYKATRNDYFGRNFDIYTNYSLDARGLQSFDETNLPLGLGASITIRKMINKHPFMKPILSRLYHFPYIRNRACEYNKPSNAFRWYSGKNPIAIGETSMNFTLKKNRKEVVDLLMDLGSKNKNDYSFVVITGPKKLKDIPSWHTLPVLNIDKEKQTISILNKKIDKETSFTFDEFINSFKAIIGVKH